jgi:hypothetical protein
VSTRRGQAPATGVLSQALALRAALSSAPARLEEAAVEPWGRRLRCRVLRWHHWQLRSTEDGGRYRACSVCAREHIGPRGPTNTIG